MSETTSLEVFTKNYFFCFDKEYFFYGSWRQFFLKKKRKNADGVSFFIIEGLASANVFFYILWVGLWHWRISCLRQPSSLPPAWVSPSWQTSSTTSASTATPAAALPDQSLLTSLEIFASIHLILHTSSVLVVSWRLSGLMALGRKRKGERGGVEM